MSTTSQPEFSEIVAVADLERGPVRRKLLATDAERAALAARFGVLSVDSLSAEVTLRRRPASPLVRVEGRLVADVMQCCIVSGEPVASRVEASFSELFCPVDYEPRDEIEEDEIVDSFTEDGIDIGELVAQHLSLSLDPYPRAAGAELPADLVSPPDQSGLGKQRPLAALGEMLRKRH